MFENLVVHKNQTLEGLISRDPFFVFDKVNRPEKMAKVFLSHILPAFMLLLSKLPFPRGRGRTNMYFIGLSVNTACIFH